MGRARARQFLAPVGDPFQEFAVLHDDELPRLLMPGCRRVDSGVEQRLQAIPAYDVGRVGPNRAPTVEDFRELAMPVEWFQNLRWLCHAESCRRARRESVGRRVHSRRDFAADTDVRVLPTALTQQCGHRSKTTRAKLSVKYARPHDPRGGMDG